MDGEMDSSGSLLGVARIKYIDENDHDWDIVNFSQITSKIKRTPSVASSKVIEERTKFLPKHFTDFDIRGLYVVRTSRKMISGEEQGCICQIQAMAGKLKIG